MKSAKYYENFSGWKYKWLTCLKGPAGHGTVSHTVSTSMWRVMNWGLWLLKCGWVYVRGHFSAWHICSLVWVSRVVCMAAFTEFLGHLLCSHGPVEQNDLKLSHLSNAVFFRQQFTFFLNIEAAEGAGWIDRRLKCDTHLCMSFLFLCSLSIFTLLTLKNESVVERTWPFPLHKHRGTPTGLWGHWFFSFAVSVSLSCSLPPPDHRLETYQLMKTSHDSDTSCCIRLCLAYVLSRTEVSTEGDEFWSRHWCVLHLCGHCAQSKSDHVTLGIFYSLLWINTSKSP